MDKKEFKILSIDGGGIKGLYTSKILEHLEAEAGSPLSDYFHLICGTSTGGLIALGLSVKIPAAELVEFYKNHGPKIFSNNLFLSRQLRFFQQLFLQSKYSANNLRTALEEIFGDHKIGDSANMLCIPAFNFSLGINRVFKYDHEHLTGTDNNLSMVDVGLATSAAPTYFPVHKIRNPYFVDGGVWANNPALVGLLEALRFFVDKNPDGKYDSISILSISSLNHGSGFHLQKRWYQVFNYRRLSFRSWGSKLFQITLDGQTEFVDFFLKSIQPNLSFGLNYNRIPSHQVDHRNVAFIDLDKASKRSMEILEEYGNNQGLKYRKNEDISKNFLSNKKSNV